MGCDRIGGCRRFRAAWRSMLALAMLLPSPGLAAAVAEKAAAPDCRVVRQGDLVSLESPHFALRLDTADGLRAVSLGNRLTGHTISLGLGPELEVELGEPGRPQSAHLRVRGLPSQWSAEGVAFELAADDQPIRARVVYRWDGRSPVLRKAVEIGNCGDRPLRVLHVRLGTYRTDLPAVSREQGFPVYLSDEVFFSLAHPAGWATAEGPQVSLRQYPGRTLKPAETLQAMETVCGVSHAGRARAAFLAHLKCRIRRVVRGHDKPYAIFEPFGARPGGDFNETEAFVLDNIAKLAAGDRDSGCHFDFYSVDFWVDFQGDLIRFDPVRFPNGLARIREELAKLGTRPGLWIDSSMTHWSIGGNPAVRPTYTHDPKSAPAGVPAMCRATEPIKSMYARAFRHHIRANGVRLLKFDNLISTCDNPGHDHLPGIYSTEAIHNAVIEFLRELDAECPDVFLMLYWGHRSPWWLLHADTLFDSGAGIEAASPSDFPAPFARDSITQKLDQAQRHAADVPALGKDSLGVWLSDWGWNSSVGKERWQEGLIMDLARGSLLAQPWSDTAWLTPEERRQMGTFIALLKSQPRCFANPRFVVGDARKGEPYGYCCCDGSRAVLALFNSTWQEAALELQLNSNWGLPDGRRWDLYRWYPSPARLQGEKPFGDVTTIALRPYEVVLLEVVPMGERPSLGRSFASQPIPTGYAEASRAVEVVVEKASPPQKPAEDKVWKRLSFVDFRSSAGAAFAIEKDGSIFASAANTEHDRYTLVAETDLTDITAVRLETLPDARLPGGGPGRAVNGNFMLNEFRVEAAPKADPGKMEVVRLRRAVADFHQDSHGGWPVAAAVDGDAKTGWSIDPAEGMPHVALFEFEKPVGSFGGTRLRFSLEHGERQHNLGRFRLSAASAPTPLPLPTGCGPAPLTLKGQAPATRHGGLLVVTLEMTRDGKPAAISNVGADFTALGTLGQQPAGWQPVLGKATYPAPWQAWRVALGPSPSPRPFTLSITTRLAAQQGWVWKAHFIAGVDR